MTKLFGKLWCVQDTRPTNDTRVAACFFDFSDRWCLSLRSEKNSPQIGSWNPKQRVRVKIKTCFETAAIRQIIEKITQIWVHAFIKFPFDHEDIQKNVMWVYMGWHVFTSNPWISRPKNEFISLAPKKNEKAVWKVRVAEKTRHFGRGKPNDSLRRWAPSRSL